MYLADYSRHSDAAQRTRRRIEVRGTAPNGGLIWGDAENLVCRKLYPDYQALRKALPHRTLQAIREHCRYIGIAATMEAWTCLEVSKLRKLYKAVSRKELLAEFPNRSAKSLMNKAQKLKLKRYRTAYLPTGDQLLDSLREECFRQKITMPDLDVFSQARGYFGNRNWGGTTRYFNYDRIVRGIYALGGTLKVEWDEQ
ncbi:hypothetical protein NKI78_04630 [Mesorhizobium sp. M0400]|uniref:hypothetical protein n=1 Tax=Mesorhizobium sp. M0400 TaxID=2956941 RepID=UPI0033356FC1